MNNNSTHHYEDKKITILLCLWSLSWCEQRLRLQFIFLKLILLAEALFEIQENL